MTVREITIDKKAAVVAFHNAAIAVHDETRVILSGAGLSMSYTNGELTVLGTDSYRLTRTLVTVTAGSKLPLPNTIVRNPKEVAARLKKMNTDYVTLRYADDGLSVAFWATNVVGASSEEHPHHSAKLIDGQYPKIDKLIPKHCEVGEGFPSFNRQYLADVGKLLHPEQGWTAAHMRDRSGNELTLSLNYISPLKPCTWHFARDGKDHNLARALYLLMPVRVKE